MSRLGKLPVEIPQGVDVKIDGSVVHMKGPKGELAMPFRVNEIAVEQSNEFVVLKPLSASKFAKAVWGTYASLLRNMVIGVTKGYVSKVVKQVRSMEDIKSQKQLPIESPIKRIVEEEITVIGG